MLPQEDALEKADVKDLLHLMQLRFRTDYGDLPYYRIASVPRDLKPDLVHTEEQRIRDILRNPPGKRQGGFSFQGVYRILPSPEGCFGIVNVGQQEITIASKMWIIFPDSNIIVPTNQQTPRRCRNYESQGYNNPD